MVVAPLTEFDGAPVGYRRDGCNIPNKGTWLWKIPVQAILEIRLKGCPIQSREPKRQPGSCAGAIREGITVSGPPDSMAASEPRTALGAVFAACSAGLGTKS